MNINDGELLVELRADISGLRTSLDQASSILQGFSNSVGNIEKQIQAQTAMMSSSFGAMTKAMQNASGQMTADTNRVINAIGTLAGAFQSAQSGVNSSITGMQGSIGRLPTTLADVARRVSASTGAINSGFSGLRSDIANQSNAINNSLTSIGTKMDSLASKMVNVRTQITRQGNLTRDALNQINSSIAQQTQRLSDAIKLSGRGISDSIRDGINDMNNFGNSTQNANRHAGGLLSTFKQFAINTYIIRAFMDFMAQKMSDLVSPGLKFAAAMEQTQLGMAGVLTSMTKVNGENTTFEQGMAMSASLMEKIKDAALITSMTTSEMSKVFMTALAPGMKAFNNDISEAGKGMSTLEKIMEFTVVASNAVRTMGLPAQQVTQEMRSLLGSAPIRAANDYLATTLGYTTETLKNLKAQGKLYGDLMERMKGFDQASKAYAGTMDGLMSNLKDGFERLSGMGFSKLFEKAKKELKDFTDKWFFTVEYIKRENGKLTPKATLNENTVKVFEKLGAVVMGVYSIFSQLGSVLLPIISQLGNIAFELFSIFTRLFTVIVPIFQYLGTEAGYALGYVSTAMQFLTENTITLTVALLALIAVNILNSSEAIVKVFVRFSHALIAAIGWVWRLVAAQAALLLEYLPVIAAVAALIGGVLALKFAYQDCMDLLLEATLTFKETWTETTLALKIMWAEFVRSFIPGINAIKTAMNATFGKIGMEKLEMSSFENETAYIESATSQMRTAYENRVAMTGAMGDRMVNIGKKVRDGIKSSMDFDISGIVKNFLEPNNVDLRKFGDDEEKNKGNKKAEGIAQAQNAKDMAEVEAERKEEVEKLKLHLKEIDYQYSQHKMSLEEYYADYRKTEREIAQIELTAIGTKQALALAEAQTVRAMGDEAAALRKETEATKLSGEYKARQLVLQEKLIDLNRKEAASVKSLLIEMEKINVEVLKRNGNTAQATEIEAKNKYKQQYDIYISEFNGITKMLNTQGAVAEADRKAMESRLAFVKQTIKNLTELEGMDIAQGHYTQMKQKYDMLSKDLSNAIAKVNVEVQRGNITEMQGKQRVLELHKEYAKRMKDLLPLMREWAKLADPSGKLLQDIEAMNTAYDQTLATVGEITQNIRDNMTSSLEQFFQEGLKNVHTLKDAFKGLFKSIFENIQKILNQRIAQRIMGEAGGNGIAGFFGGLFGDKKPKANPVASSAKSSLMGAIPQFYTPPNSGGGNKFGFDAKSLGLDKVKKDFSAVGQSANNLNISNKLLDTSFKTTSATTKAGEIVEKASTVATELGTSTTETTTSLLVTAFTALEAAAVKAAASLAAMKVGAATGGYIKKFSSGGAVFGSGTSTSDDIDAKLSDGEYVIRAASVKKYGLNYLNSINSGSLPPLKFAEGGSVSGGSSGKTGDTVGSNSSSTAKMSQQVQVSFNPVFQSLDPAENMKQFEKQFPMFKQKMLEAINTEPSTRSVIRKANK